MRHHLFALPASLLTLLSSSQFAVAENSSPSDSASRSQFGPDEHDVHDQERMGWRSPLGVRKMSGDAGEKFFMDYWQVSGGLEENTGKQGVRKRAEPGTVGGIYGNASMSDSLLPPLLLHSDTHIQYPYLRFFHRNVFDKRNFQCPSGTSSCSNIDRPNSCCASGEICVIVTDTGLGDVGCCPEGDDCGGSVSSCDTDAGYKSCPDSQNGGCCIPGYACEDVGCIISGTTTVTTTIPSTVTAARSSASPSSSIKSTSTSTSSPLTTRLSTTDLTTTTSLTSLSVTTTTSAVAPVRPTSGSDSVTTTTSPSTTYSGCPTGFYRCSAYYEGGCCRVGRDCHSTSCPAVASTSVLVTDGVTILAPSGATTADSGGACAAGWYSCAQSLGGDCCPSGYGCGARSCTATATDASTTTSVEVSKESASKTSIASGIDSWGSMMTAAALAAASLMVVYGWV